MIGCLILGGSVCFKTFLLVEVLKHRRVRHYGYKFKYNCNDVDRQQLHDKIPVPCYGLLNRLLNCGYITSLPDQLTVNQYQPGQGAVAI